MLFQPLAKLPAPETEPASDWSLISQQGANKSSVLLVYAVKRDFLSVPKTYAVVEFCGDVQFAPELHQLDAAGYLEELELTDATPAAGVYQLDAGDDYPLALFLTQESALEIAYVRLHSHKEIYHCDSALSALKQHLSQG